MTRKPKPQNETWFDFMDRAKANGLSPARQEQVDRERESHDDCALLTAAPTKTQKKCWHCRRVIEFNVSGKACDYGRAWPKTVRKKDVACSFFLG